MGCRFLARGTGVLRRGMPCIGEPHPLWIDGAGRFVSNYMTLNWEKLNT
jgi:hypothetical protein